VLGVSAVIRETQECGGCRKHHDAAIIRLWRDALLRKPWRLDAIERTDELLPGTLIEEALSTGASVQFDKALTVDEIGNEN
jgi:hypothetical protein